MSVVAVKKEKDKITIGADSFRGKGGGTQDKDENAKIAVIKKDEFVFGVVGYADDKFLFEVFCQTHTPEENTEKGILRFYGEFDRWVKQESNNNKRIQSEFMLVWKNKVWFMDNYYVREIDDYDAMGAGQDFALSALYLGHTVEQAIDSATEFSVYCEKPINVIEISTKK